MNKLVDKNGIVVCEDDFGKIYINQKNPNGVVMLASDNEHLILIKQFRKPVGSYIIQLPGGGVEEGEQLEFAAKREFKEETGFECGKVHYIGNVLPASWRSNEVTHVFFTEEIMNHTGQQLEKHENIEVIRISISDCVDAIKENRFTDSELCYAVLQAILKGFIKL